MEELSDFLKDKTSSLIQNNDIRNENTTDAKENLLNIEKTLDEKLNKHRKEGHLYFVTEDMLYNEENGGKIEK